MASVISQIQSWFVVVVVVFDLLIRDGILKVRSATDKDWRRGKYKEGKPFCKMFRKYQDL